MAENIKSVFDKEAKNSNFKVDKALLGRIYRFEREFVTRNRDHVEFFSGNLLGVERVKFLNRDIDRWWDDVLQIDDISLKERLYSLNTVNPNHNVGGDATYLSFVWLAHTILNSSLSSKDKHDGMINTFMIFQFKAITSKISWDFKLSPADRDVAIATYSTLSKKFDLKQAGSWYEWLKGRAEDIISPQGIHYKTLQKMETDKAVIYVATDTQGRIRESLKNMRDKFDMVLKSDAKLAARAATIKGEDGDEIRDLNRWSSEYKNYIKSIVPDERSLIKEELIEIISAGMHTMNPDHMVSALKYISDRFGRDRTVDNYVDELVVHFFSFMTRDKELMAKRKDIGFIIAKIRGVYMSSRSTDPALLSLRKLGNQITAKSVRSRSSSARISARTGTMLYIILRMLAKDHYA